MLCHISELCGFSIAYFLLRCVDFVFSNDYYALCHIVSNIFLKKNYRTQKNGGCVDFALQLPENGCSFRVRVRTIAPLRGD